MQRKWERDARAVAAAWLGATLALAAAAQPPAVSAAEYRAARERIAAELKEHSAACERLRDNAKDVCRAAAKGKERVARAELEFNRSDDPKDAARLAIAKADAAFDVASEKCAARAGVEQDICAKEAKAAHVRAVADAKAEEKIDEARRDAADEKRAADYDLARQKCDALGGASKGACLEAAKNRFGKS